MSRAAQLVGFGYALHERSPLEALPTHPFDLEFGVDTSGLIPGADLATGHAYDLYNTAYYAMSPSRFHVAMNRWAREIDANAIGNYTFVDVGSGKGRAVLMASGMPFRRVIGVELNPVLARVAEANVQRWVLDGRAVAFISIICQEATQFHFPPGACLIYLFHPFTAPVMERLLNSLETQFAHRRSALDILYFNPELRDLIEHHPGFQHLWTERFAICTQETSADPLIGDGDLCSAFRWIGIHQS